MKEIGNKKNYFFTLFAGFGGTLIATLISLVSLPLSFKYWGTEKYGIWTLLTSILVYLNMSNLGMNSAASVLMAKNPDIRVKIKILKRTFHILIISVLVFLSFFITLNIYDKNWITILGKIPDALKNEAFLTCLILGTFFLINLPFSLLESILQGFQKAYIQNIFTIIATIINFLNLLLVIFFNGNLVLFALVNGINNLVLNICKGLYIYFKLLKKVDYKEVHNNIKIINQDTSYKYIFLTGIRFFLNALASMVVWNTDNLLISNFLGIEKVTPYSITFKMFQITFNIIFIINSSISSIISKEFGNNNWTWINESYKKLLVIVVAAAGLIWVGGVLFLKDIIFLFVGNKGYAGILAVLALGGYSYLLSLANLNSGLMNSLNYTKWMPLVGWTEAIVNIGFSILLLKYLDLGGVALGTFLGALLSGAWLYPLLIRKHSENKINGHYTFIVKHVLLVIIPILVLGILGYYHISHIVLRLGVNVVLLFAYCLITYILIPKDIKYFLISIIGSLISKIKNAVFSRRIK